MNVPNEVPYYWLTAKAYAKQTGMGYDDTLRMCRTRELIATQTEGGQWRIKVQRDTNSIPHEEIQKIINENIELKIQIETIRKLITKSSFHDDNKTFLKY